MNINFEKDSIEIYIGKLRIELWYGVIESYAGVKIYIWPALQAIKTEPIAGMILTLSWLKYLIGFSVRWLQPGEEV